MMIGNILSAVLSEELKTKKTPWTSTEVTNSPFSSHSFEVVLGKLLFDVRSSLWSSNSSLHKVDTTSHE